MKQIEKIVVYESKLKRGFFSILFEGFLNLFKSNFLAYQIAKRDISAQYRQSILGVLWTIFLPLSTAMIWIFMKASSTVQLIDTGIPYPLFVFTGTMAWAILTESMMGTMQTTQTMRTTLSKINFPKEALIMAGIYKTLFNVFIKLIILVVFLIFFKQAFSVYVLLFPLALFVMILFGTAFGLLITPIGLLYGDINRLLTPLMQILMYFSPVVFVVQESQSFYGKLLQYNPLSSLVNNFRNTLVGLPLEQTQYYAFIVFLSFGVFCFSLVYYKITIPIIIERIGG